MSRTLQLAAILVFLAVFILLLTPADDGPVMEARGNLSAALLFGLLVFTARITTRFVPRVRCSLGLMRCHPSFECGHAPSAISPLLC